MQFTGQIDEFDITSEVEDALDNSGVISDIQNDVEALQSETYDFQRSLDDLEAQVEHVTNAVDELRGIGGDTNERRIAELELFAHTARNYFTSLDERLEYVEGLVARIMRGVEALNQSVLGTQTN